MTNPAPEDGSVARLEEGSPGTAASRGCPFLLADAGGWRLDVPSKDHRCTAVSPPAPLSLEKQARLCLTVAHPSCATYLASIEARGARLGAPSPRGTRWGLARTTAVIQDSGGVRSRVLGALADRRRWPAVPAVLLLTGLTVLGFSGLRGTPASAVASPTPSRPAAEASATPEATPRPTDVPPTDEPTIAPTAAATPRPTPRPTPTARPSESFRTYTVRNGDTLSGIAGRFGTTSRAIADLNGISINKILHAGDVLKIPHS